MAPIEKNVQLDLENGPTSSKEDNQIKNPFQGLNNMAQVLISKFRGSFSEKSDDGASLAVGASNSSSANVEAVATSTKKEAQDSKDGNRNKKGVVKEKRNKKAAKLPRPPKGPTLDAADRKLIRDLTELARLKRARIEKTRALKKMKAPKGMSSNTTIFVMLFTIIFCIIIIYLGMSYRGTPTNSEGSVIPVGTLEGGGIPIKLFGNPSSSVSNRPHSGSPFMVEQVAGLDSRERLNRLLWI